MLYLSIKLPFNTLTHYAREGLLPFLSFFPEASLENGHILLTCLLGNPKGKGARQIEEAVFDAIYTFQWIGVDVAVEKIETENDLEKKSENIMTNANVVRLFSLFLLSLYQSQFSGFAPSAHAALPQKISERLWPTDELIRYYSLAKVQTVIALKARLSLDPDRLTSVGISREEFDRISLTTESAFASSPAIAPLSLGIYDKERVIVFQVARDVTEKNKFYDFVRSYFKNGIYLRPIASTIKFDFRLNKAFKNEMKKGIFEFSFLVAPGITYDHILSCMKSFGALKKEMIHHVDLGYNDSSLDKTVRVSEWYALKNGLFMAAGSSRYEKIPTYIAEVLKRE